ncbi:MAG: group II intron reverse transcriptase domain-containing protein [Spirochaetales bacterium]|nr:group II intron reverse transcriptase domain-containing protein [Spirochaetales bacterium]
MSKRVGNLWPQICDYGNLYQAYLATVKGRRYKLPLLKYTANLDYNLNRLHNELVSLKWQPRIAFTKIVYFPKKRVITAPIPYDRVAFHAIVDVIRPYFEKRFISDSYACIAGRGTFHAVCRVQRMIYGVHKHSSGGGYVLKADIHAYFANIDHSICKNLIRKVIKDPSVLLILDRIIDSSPGDVGLPLGALSSQLMANVYLNELDHFIKETLQVRNYVRFMDDFVIVEESKAVLR